MSRIFCIVLLAMWWATCAFASAGELYVVVNADSTVKTLTPREVVSLFTGRTRAFPSGDLAQAFDHPSSSAVREAFYMTLTGMDLARVNSYWARLQYTGQVQPPTKLADDSAVVERVRKDRRGIGYLTTRPQDPALRVVLVLQDVSLTNTQ